MSLRANIYIDLNTNFSVDLELFDEIGIPYQSDTAKFYSSLSKIYSSVYRLDFQVKKSAGFLTLSLTKEQTSILIPGKYIYDVILVDDDGNSTKIIEGLAFVNPTVTSILGR